MNRLAGRIALATTAVGSLGIGITDCMGVAGATQGDGTYTCFEGRVVTEVIVRGRTLTSNFDAAEYTAPDGEVKAVHRLPDGTVPDLTFDLDGVYTSVTFRPHYTGPNGADARTPLVVAHIDGAVPDCTPATTAPATTSPSTTTTAPPATTSSTPGSSTTVHTPPSTAPPATSPRTLPATGAGDAIPVVAIGAALVLGCGVVAVAVTRRRKP